MTSPDTPPQIPFPAAFGAVAPRVLRSRGGATRGAALIIVLAFVVLLVAMVLAFFSMTTSERQISDSSSNEAKVNLLAQGVGDQILGDLRQEIVAGSLNIGTGTNPVYVPKTTTTMIQAMPARSGLNGSGSLPPNVLKRSASGQPFYPATGYDANGPLRASSDPSTNATRAGRSISLSRWNAALLLPKRNVASSTDLTPITDGTNGFVAPDWIYVTAQGSNPVLSAGRIPAANTVTGNAPVIGRYAYVIYHEGGLLDMNVAGYPPLNYTPSDIIIQRSKPLPSYVDLTAIPGIGANDPVSGAGPLSTANQNNLTNLLVGWRNYASAGVSGSMGTLASPGYSFTYSSNYFTNMIGATNGFLTTARVPLNNSQSDRAFTSRQELIRFLQDAAGTDTASLASLQNALQYLGTFSRSLDQPSYVTPLWYNTNAPRVIGGIGSSPNFTDYPGGNNAFGSDSNINVAFPSLLVTSSFTRNDSNNAVVGEPLVKKRFPLDRLAWLTYKGPSAARNLSDPDMASLLTNPGVTQALLAQGTAANIRNCFGLTWNAAGYWEYSPSTGSAGSIATLGSLTGSREPNFPELLKATISMGSLGKSMGLRMTPGPVTDFYSDVTAARNIHLRNASVDYHVLRLMANIMDQADADGYPTTIRFVSSSPNPTQTYLINGTENLPYIYRTRHLLVRAKEGQYRTPGGVLTNFPVASQATFQGTIVDQGVGVMMMIPEIWNPHDQNSSMGIPYPTNCRIIAENTNNLVIFAFADTSMYTTYSNSLPTNPPFPSGFTRVIPNPVNLTSNNSALLFTNATNLFRDPTSLLMTNIPAGSGLQLAPTHILRPGNFSTVSSAPLFSGVVQSGGGVKEPTDPPTIAPRIGFYLGCVPLLQQVIVGGVTNVGCGEMAGTTYRAWEKATYFTSSSGTVGAFTLRLQYENPITPNQWCDYDVKNWDIKSPFAIRDPYIKAAPLIDLDGFRLPGLSTTAYVIDPRSGRFGIALGWSQNGDPRLLTPNVTMRVTSINDSPSQISFTNWVRNFGNSMGAMRYATNTYVYYEFNGGLYNSGSSGFNFNAAANDIEKIDLFSQNSTNLTPSVYYRDADGMIRKGMSAYTPISGVSASSSIGLPTISPSTFSGTGVNLTITPTAQSQSRPMILNRPFRSVAELGYVFSDLPWKQLDFFTPESGYAALLDTFCIRDQATANGLSAGKVSLNSRQAPVIQAVMAGGMIDELLRSGTSVRMLSDTNVAIASSAAASMATNLVSRTSTNTLYNVADLVGRWVSGTSSNAIYDGFSRDINLGNTTNNVIQRFREAPIRALSNTGQTRVWNLMIDLVAQTGKFPPGASNLNQFIVTGEKRLWLHVAIDRVTGKVLDSVVEPVNE